LPDSITLTCEQVAAVALSAMRAVCGEDRYQYLSGPITGGPRLIDWHLSAGRNLPDTERSRARRTAVFGPNIAEVVAEARRQRLAGVRTIEPGSFEAEFEGWGQKQFYEFWDSVMKAHSDRVTFIPGWEYSAGCAFEYWRARRHGLPTFTLAGANLDKSSALAAIDTALQHIAQSYTPEDSRDEAIARLHAAIAGYRLEIAST
jgi:hypothetical protein